jgi:cell division protein FtsX
LYGGTAIALIAVGVYAWNWWYAQQNSIPLSIQNLGTIFTKNIDNILVLAAGGIGIGIIMLLMVNHLMSKTG